MDEVGRNKLWQEYMQTGKSEIREQLIAEYAQLVKLVAGRLSLKVMLVLESVAQYWTRFVKWTGFRGQSVRSRKK